ncbi:MAG: RCC1 domain-containing protein [Chloroflexia bacterium]
MAVKAMRTVVAWGGNNYDGATDVPAAERRATAIAAGDFYSRRKGDGTVVAWGYNWDGQRVPGGRSASPLSQPVRAAVALL